MALFPMNIVGGGGTAEIVAIKSAVSGSSGGTVTFDTLVNDLIIVTTNTTYSGNITVTGATDVTNEYSSIIDPSSTTTYFRIYRATGTTVTVKNTFATANRSSIQIRGIT